MPYENWVAVTLVFLVLLAPFLRWAMRVWMNIESIRIDGRDYELPCGSLASFKKSLSEQVDADATWKGKELLFTHKAAVLEQLEDKGAWSVASELLEMTSREYIFYAVSKKLWGAVRYFMQLAGLSSSDVTKLLSLGLPDDLQRDLRRLKADRLSH